MMFFPTLVSRFKNHTQENGGEFLNTIFVRSVKEGDILSDTDGRYYYVLSAESNVIHALSSDGKAQRIHPVLLNESINKVFVVRVQIIKDYVEQKFRSIIEKRVDLEFDRWDKEVESENEHSQ